LMRSQCCNSFFFITGKEVKVTRALVTGKLFLPSLRFSSKARAKVLGSVLIHNITLGWTSLWGANTYLAPLYVTGESFTTFPPFKTKLATYNSSLERKIGRFTSSGF